MENKLIISMTSFPPRIKGVAKVFYSIFAQNVDSNLYHCVLVLAEPEFPNKENDLPADLRLLIENKLIELIWYPVNIKSHKKLMPTLTKYPDNDILIIDDDVIRPAGWLECFMKDHKEHPNDIIAGLISYHIVNDKFVMFNNKYKRCLEYGFIIKNGRPANGHGGTLYPAHTFTDKRFFDENLFMKLSPTSDESWQFYFNWKEQKPIRLISKDFNIWNFIKGSQEQKTALYKSNMPKYDKIWMNIKRGVENEK